jgi:hypothetical protein
MGAFVKKCVNCYYTGQHCTAGHSRLFNLADVETKCKDWHERVMCKAYELKYHACTTEFPAHNENHLFCSHGCRNKWHAAQRSKGLLRGFAAYAGLLLQEYLRDQGMSQPQIDKNFKEHGLHW